MGGRIGGRSRSEKKIAAARTNGLKGGRKKTPAETTAPARSSTPAPAQPTPLPFLFTPRT